MNRVPAARWSDVCLRARVAVQEGDDRPMDQATNSPRAAWRRGDGTNLIGIPTGLFASAAFNSAHRPVQIAGVREMNADLFKLLATAGSMEEASGLFSAYMATMFGLADGRVPVRSEVAPNEPPPRRHYRSSYLRLLRGWAFDSNGSEGAVLKGWVESRFGLVPTYHRQPLTDFHTAAWSQYVEEKMSSRFHNNAILSQLDLLYEFAQWFLARFQPEQTHLRLYRGVNDFEEHQIVERRPRRQVVLRLNNLVSFTSERDMASWFGDHILEAEVPKTKVLFFTTLLPRHALKGEGELLVIGGDYLVTASYY